MLGAIKAMPAILGTISFNSGRFKRFARGGGGNNSLKFLV
jgi:hypothetical protein